MGDSTDMPKSGRKRRKLHDAVYASVSVHYILSSHTSRPLNIRRATRRLLAKDIAVSAAWPSDDAILVAKRFRKPSRALARLRSLDANYAKYEAAPSLGSAIPFALRHPSIGIIAVRGEMKKVAIADLRRFFTTTTVPKLVLARYFLRHPIFAVRHVLPNLTFSKRDAGRVDTLTDSDGEFIDWEEDEAEEDITPTRDSGSAIGDKIDEIERLMLDEQVVSAAERHSDAQLLGGRDRDEGRFVRLVLRSSTHELLIPGTQATHKVVIEPRLFLHESGAVQLSVQVVTDGPLSTEQVVKAMWGAEPLVTESRLARPLLGRYGLDRLVSSWEEKEDARQRVAVIEHDGALSMTDLMISQLMVVGSAIGSALPQHWLNYPAAIVGVGDCCPSGAWRSVHADDIVRIRTRYRSSIPLSNQTDERDFSRQSDHSLFANAATATYFQWTGAAPRGIPELQTTLVVEYALYLFQRLEMLERKVADLPLGNRRLRSLYRSAILVFSELRQGNMRAGDAREISSHLVRELGGFEIRSTIETALNLAGMAHATVSATRSSRRAWVLALLGTVVAVVVAYPQIEAALAKVADLPDSQAFEWAAAPLRYIASLGPWGTLVALIAVGIAVSWTPTALRFLRAVARALTPRGYVWPTRLTVEPDDEDEAMDGSGKPEQG